MGRGIAPWAQDTPVPEPPLAPCPPTDTGNTSGTAAMRGTGRPHTHPATGGLGLTTGATVTWGKGESTRETAAGSRGVPGVRSTVWDPVTATNQTAPMDLCMKSKLRAAWDQAVGPDEPLGQLPGQKTCRTEGIPSGQSPAKTGLASCLTPCSQWSWINQTWRRRWTWIHPGQNTPGTPAVCLCALPSEGTSSNAGVPGQPRTRCSGSIANINWEPPNTTSCLLSWQ